MGGGVEGGELYGHDVKALQGFSRQAGEWDFGEAAGSDPVQIVLRGGNCAAQATVLRATRGKDLNVVVRVCDGVADSKDGFAALHGVLRERGKLVHAWHETDCGGPTLQEHLGDGAAFAQTEQICCGPAQLCGARRRDVLATCAADGVDGTVEAERRARETDSCAKLHHGLVVVSGCVDGADDAAPGYEGAGLCLHEGAAGGGLGFGVAGEAQED